MKRINRNYENRQRVRVIETGELGTVTDQQLMKRGGELLRYMQVRMDKRPHLDRWFWDDQLGGTRERCRVTMEHESGQALVFNLEMDYEKDQDITMELTAKNPVNIREHRGLHVRMASHLLEGFTARNVEME